MDQSENTTYPILIPETGSYDVANSIFSSTTLIVFYSILIAIGLIGNFIVIIATCLDATMRVIGNVLHVSLAIVDIVSLITFSLFLWNFNAPDYAYRNIVSMVICCVINNNFYVSLFMIVAICIIRVVRFRNPLYILTKTMATLIIITCITLALLLVILRKLSRPFPAFVALCGGDESAINLIPGPISRLIQITVFFLSVIVILCAYGLCLWHLKRTNRVDSSPHVTPGSGDLIGAPDVTYNVASATVWINCGNYSNRGAWASGMSSSRNGETFGSGRNGQRLESGRNRQMLESSSNGQSLESGRNGQRLESGRNGQMLESSANGQSLESGQDGQRLESGRNGQSLESSANGQMLASGR